MRRRTVVAAILAVPLAAGACLKGTCQQSGVFGVEVSVRDNTGNAIADSVTAYLSAASFRDTMAVVGVDPNSGRALWLGGAIDRAGVYGLCMHRPGFADFIQPRIIVSATTCGIQPQVINAIMVAPTDTSTVCT